jgi:hypothetical protein
MLSVFQLLLRQIAASWAGHRAHRPQRALAVEQFERRELLATVTLTAIADNTIFQDQTSHADGAGPSIFAGETSRGLGARRALLKFDVAANVPAGAHIDSVSLQLHVVKDRFSSNDFGVYRLTDSWGEGASSSGLNGGDGINALANDATWAVRFTGASPAQPWTNQGGDFNAASPSATTAVGTGLGTSFFQWTSPQLATDVQNWLNSPSTQFGWLIKAVDESAAGSAEEFDSRESGTAANRPQLTIAYTLAGNQPPTLDPINDPAAILEDAGQQTIGLAGISAGTGETQNLAISVTSSNPALIPTPAVNYTSPSATGSLSYTPAANQSGTAIITVKVQDDGGTANGGIDAITRTFTVHVNPVNDPPTLSAITDPANILEDSGQQTINLSGISAGPSETQSLTVTATSSNPALVPNPTVVYSSPSSTGSLSYTPIANHFGTAVITVKLTDDGGTASGGVDFVTRTFTVRVDGVNDAPTLDPISDPAAILAGAGQQSVSLSGISAGPLETQVITITATSSNPNLIPNPTVIYTSPNAAGSLSYAPAANQTGSAVITVTVKDNGGTASGGVDTITRTFNVQVNSADFVNHAPSFQKGADQASTDENGPVSVTGWATSISPGAADEASQTLNFIVTTDNDALFAAKPSVDAAGKLTFTPAANAHGLAHVSVQLHDNGGTANGGVDTSAAQAFSITITKPHPWHNTARPLDVTGDGFIAANDALAIINYINAFQAGPVPAGAPFGPNYLDPSNDSFVAANDALQVINFINANPNGEGEAAATNVQATDSLMQQLDALLLFGGDPAAQQRRRVS